ncbi:hypothetical protein CC80DRAFT_594765 [Byssothecium circinans]|uniref:Uncharacterized protein n=1 Tax=Byssothecium circinans TaxID=147558 RepID=A0A6A5U0I7_9PLEO|nr:hypothetical protein CC80DRAFT_594765 [Byssothecium circinans]
MAAGLGAFDPADLDPEFWNSIGPVDDMGFQGDFSGFGDFGLPNDNFAMPNTFDNTFDPRASFNLLQNPFSALPGALASTGFNDACIDPTLDMYDFRQTASQPQLNGVQSTHAASPVPSRRSSRNKTPLRDSFAEPQTHEYRSCDPPYKPPYGYPVPAYPRHANNAPYYAGPSRLEDESLFISESDASPGTGHSRSRSISQTSPERRRSESRTTESSYPEAMRSRSSLSSSDESARLARGKKKRQSVFEGRFKYETPQIDANKPWIRTNATTKGLTTRTAKLNSYDPSQFYHYTPHPLGSWRTKRNIFEYTKHGELREKTYSADQIRDFILHYPEDKANKIQLQLFIQIGPTDSARRYLSSTWGKCRFQECPVNIHEKGTILHGHYRVALDERSYGTNNRYDPHLAASGYVHLYCMERFLDFEYICRHAHVKVDNRQYSTEPKGKFHATLGGRPECGIAQEFVKYAAKNSLRTSVPEFANYPVHAQYHNGQAKPHEHTLTATLHQAKADTRPPAQIKQFQERGLGVTHILVNKGDLEMIMTEKTRKKAKTQLENTRRKAKRRIEEVESDDDVDAEYAEKRRRMVAEAKKTYKAASDKAPRSTKGKGKAPKSPAFSSSPSSPATPGVGPSGRYPWDKDDDESSDEEHMRNSVGSSSRPTRRSPRNSRKAVNYSEDPDSVPSGYRSAAPHHRNNSTHRNSFTTFYDPELEGVDFDALMAAEGLDDIPLNRRVSSIPSFRALSSRSGSIMRSPGSRAPPFTPRRHASFNKQPVTQSRTFDTDAPPQDMERRRTRQQSKAAVANAHRVKDGRVEKRPSRSR